MCANSLPGFDIRRVTAWDIVSVAASAQSICVIFRGSEWSCENESWINTGGQGND